MNIHTNIVWDGTRSVVEGISPAVDALIEAALAVTDDAAELDRLHRKVFEWVRAGNDPRTFPDQKRADKFYAAGQRKQAYMTALQAVLGVDYPRDRNGQYCITTGGDAVFLAYPDTIYALTKKCAPYSNHKKWTGDLWDLFPVGVSRSPDKGGSPQPGDDLVYCAAVKLAFEQAKERRAAQ